MKLNIKISKVSIKPGYFFRYKDIYKFKVICLSKDTEGWIMMSFPNPPYFIKKDPYSYYVQPVSKEEYEEVADTKTYPWERSNKYYKFDFEHPIYDQPINPKDLFGPRGKLLYLNCDDKPLSDQSLSNVPRKGKAIIDLFQHVIDLHYENAKKDSVDALTSPKKIPAYEYVINEKSYQRVKQLYRYNQLNKSTDARLIQLMAISDVKKYWFWVGRLLDTMKDNKDIEIEEYSIAKSLLYNKLTLCKDFKVIFQVSN